MGSGSFFAENIWSIQKKAVILQPISELTNQKAQMAESVDALVSNTSRFTPVPVRPRLWVQNPLNKDC